ncbi:MAG TPA: biotin/lipoyl-containing protein [Polyangiaceae bacterium]
MKLQINIDGRQYEADIEVLEDEQKDAPAQTAARPAAKRATGSIAPPAAESAPSSAASDDKVCKSSIVGIVVSVVVKVGQEVKVGEPLLVLEAMKMESTVASPLSGRVKAVCVAQGESVKKGQVLIEFE